MAHGVTEVVVPVGTVEAEAARGGHLVITKKHDIGDVGKIVVGSNGLVAAGHLDVAVLAPNLKSASRGRIPFATRYWEFINLLVPLIGVEFLIIEIYIDSFFSIIVT